MKNFVRLLNTIYNIVYICIVKHLIKQMEKQITIENLQQDVAALTAKVESLEKERDNYRSWYNQEHERASKLLRTVKALAQLTADAAGLEIIQPVNF